MTTLFTHGPSRGRPTLAATPLLRGLPGRLTAAWRNRLARREMESLSYDTRKDIGFR